MILKRGPCQQGLNNFIGETNLHRKQSTSTNVQLYNGEKLRIFIVNNFSRKKDYAKK